MAKILIAGGTGLIGRAIEKRFITEGHDVFILTRSPKKDNHVGWDLNKKTIDQDKIQDTEILINLCGESVGEGRWTDKRKKVLLSSRVDTTNFLFETFHGQKSLKQYITASGIDAYPLDQNQKEMTESDAYGSDYLSQLVKKWEEAADIFSRIVPVTKMRISMVLSPEGGALQKLLPLVKFRIASPVGKGSQFVTWVHIDDLAKSFSHAIDKQLEGAYNITGEPITNRLFMDALMKAHGRKMWAPNIPVFVMKLLLGEQATIILDGAFADRRKFKETGFSYDYATIKGAFEGLFKKK